MRLVAILAAMLLTAAPVCAQSPLTLADAITRARAFNTGVATAAAAEREAIQRVTEARGAYYPKVDVAESWQRGDHPVFVFSSILAQRQFTSAGFALDALNHPAVTDNFRTVLSIEQPLLDRTTSANVRAASIAREITAIARRQVDQDLAPAVTEAFGRVLIAAATVRSTAAMVETARADRAMARDRRDAGRVTDADVLQLDVYLARTLEQQVQASADERIARARLNQLMGEPLGAVFFLDPAPESPAVDITNPAALEEDAVRTRPEIALARQQQRLATAAVDAARAAFLPQVAAQGAWEWNGGTWSSRSPSWVAGAAARINVFHGVADKARIAAAREQAARRAVELAHAETMVRLDVQTATARLDAAHATEAAGRAAADQARESRRIIRDRYASGLTDAAMLLRSAEAVQQADARQIAARVGVLTATANLQRAIGRP